MTVRLRCRRCHAQHELELQVGIKADGSFTIPAGTLSNDWALRWARSHMEPEAGVMVYE